MSDEPMPDPQLKRGQIWHTSEGKIMITGHPQKATPPSPEWFVEHINEQHGENKGYLYTHKGQWSIGQDATPVTFHEQHLFNDRRN